jgi:PPOX class probable F420-dependent enzyme
VEELALHEMQAFLAEPMIATIATYRRDGSTLLSPVWQEWTGRVFHVLVGRTDIKAKHVRHDPRVGIVVYEQTPPYRGVEAAGTAALVEGMYAELLERMAPRYLPNGLPDVLARDGLVLALTPTRFRSWSFASWF